MVNSSPVNGIAVNSSPSTGVIDETLLDSFTLSTEPVIAIGSIYVTDSFSVQTTGVAGLLEALYASVDLSLISSDARLIELIESLIVDDTLLDDVFFGIVDGLKLSSGLSTSAVIGNILESDIVIDDITELLFIGVIAENLEISHTELIHSLYLSSILDIFNTDDTLENKIEASNTLACSLVLADAALIYAVAGVSEALTVTQSSVDLLNAFSELIAALTLVHTSSEYLLLVSSVEDNIEVNDVNSTSSVLAESVLDGLQIITLPDILEASEYTGWVMNPETFSVWNYDNYNFNAIATLNRKTFFASSDGLFFMEGVKDDGAFIQSKLKTASFNFGTTNLKKVPNMYIGSSTDGSIILKVKTDERVHVSYKLTKHSDVSEVQNIKIGKGLFGSLWQFEIIDENATKFDLESIEWVPAVFGRKRR